MKKLLCLALCLIMVLSMLLVGCGKDNGEIGDDPLDQEEEVRNAITLKFYIVTDEITTSDAKEAMQDAFNNVSRAKYSTQVEFVFCTADEYKATLDAALDAASKSIEDGKEKPSKVYEGYEVVTELDEFNLPNLIYPDALDNQIDIVLITGKEMLEEYIEKDYILDITNLLDGENSAIKEYTNTSLLTNTKINKKWYAVPNNVVVGQYKYLLVNKELASNYYLVESDFTEVNADGKTVVNYLTCLDFVKSIANDDSLKNIAPIYKMFDFPTAQFWSLDGSPFALSTFYAPDTGYGDYVKVSNTFENQTYIDYLKFVKESENNGYVAENPESAEGFGLKVVYDDYASRYTYGEDYYVITLDNPRVYANDGFDAMFAVSAFTASETRSMEIIEDLLTTSDLCNTLLYGVEGSDYYFDEEDKTVSRIANEYKMDSRYTGNVFMTYPCVSDGMFKNHWNYGMLQNQEVSSDPLEGLTSEDIWLSVKTAIINDQMLMMAQNEVLEVVGEAMTSGNINDYVLRLQQFYAGIDPNAEPEVVKPGETTTEPVTISAEIKKQVNELVFGKTEKVQNEDGTYTTVTSGGFREIATNIATETLDNVMAKSKEYFDKLDSCNTAAEIEAAVAEIKDDMAKSYLFNNTRVGDWKDTTVTMKNLDGEDALYTAPFGMLQLQYRDAPVESSLAGALLYWYRNITK